MTTFERLTRNEQVLLLGFLPLLGATAHFGAALLAALIGVAGVFLIRFARSRIAGRFDPGTEWTIYAALGYALAFFVTSVMTFVFPVPASLVIYLHLSGLTPLVFIGVSDDRPLRELGSICLRFALWAAAFGLVRESLGNGTLFGLPLWSPGTIPFGLLASSAGAFIVFATAACSRAVFIRPRQSARESGA